jgi:hypothetical protein
MNEREETKFNKTANKKFPIVCKFWMMNTCNKNDKCAYLHQQIDKRAPMQSDVECPWYGFGFCKNGPKCQFKHTVKDEAGLPSELPAWYLEYIYGKPIKNIFDEFEKNFPGEFKQVRNRLQVPYGGSHFKTYDNYAVKKNSIIENLNKKVRYFYIRCKTMDIVKYTMEFNILPVNKMSIIKFKEAKKSCDDVIFIIFDESSNNFYGYCKFKYDLEEKGYDISSIDIHDLGKVGFSFVKVEWLWKTKLSESKIELLRNPLTDGDLVINSRDGQEIAIDIGYYMCRLMIKRLTKEEVQEYIIKKKELDRTKQELMASGRLSSTPESTVEGSNSSTTGIININNVKLGNNMDTDGDKAITAIKDNLNNLIYDELHRNKQTNSIIVTNISNLQVNISQNSYCENKVDLGDFYTDKKRHKSSRHKRRRISTDEEEYE